LFLPRNPALHATAEELDLCESAMNMEDMVRRGVDSAALERYRFAAGRVEQVESIRSATA
jgi:hypothetical protein